MPHIICPRHVLYISAGNIEERIQLRYDWKMCWSFTNNILDVWNVNDISKIGIQPYACGAWVHKAIAKILSVLIGASQCSHFSVSFFVYILHSPTFHVIEGGDTALLFNSSSAPRAGTDVGI